MGGKKLICERSSLANRPAPTAGDALIYSPLPAHSLKQPRYSDNSYMSMPFLLCASLSFSSTNEWPVQSASIREQIQHHAGGTQSRIMKLASCIIVCACALVSRTVEAFVPAGLPRSFAGTASARRAVASSPTDSSRRVSGCLCLYIIKNSESLRF